MFKVEEENMVQDYENFIIPYDLSKIIIKNCEEQLLTILDIPSQIYGKALHGDCKAEFKNGNNYAGEFYNGMLHGKGTLTWEDSTVYTGEFVYNKIQGQGEYRFKDGSSYEGEVQNGLRHGQGKYTSKNGEVVYQGQWAWGHREGKGQLDFISGANYLGHFLKGVKEGRGRMTYPSGNFYEGQWKVDEKEGYGNMTWQEEKYQGLWVSNVQHTLGTHLWLEQRGEGKYLRNRYEGQWVQGQRAHFGTFYYANGSKYVGYWNANYKHGFAKFIDEHGKIVKAFFKNDRQLHFAKALNEESQDQQLSQVQSNSQKQNKPVIQTGKPKEEGKQKEVEANPYYSQLNISDVLDTSNPEHMQIQKELYNILLRHNMLLKKIYKGLCLDEGYDFYNNDAEMDNDNSFSLNLYKIYKLFRETRLLTANASLANLNRLFFQGVNNRYQLNILEKDNGDINQLAKQKSILEYQQMVYVQNMQEQDFELTVTQDWTDSVKYKQVKELNKEQIAYLDSLDDEGLDEYFQILLLSQDKQSKDKCNMHYDIHNGRILVLFRHMVELIVRLTVLREDGKLQGLAKKVEEIIVQRLSSYVNDGIQKKDVQLDEEKILTEKYKEISGISGLHDIFIQNSIQGTTSYLYKQDRTIGFKRLVEMLQQANLIKGEKELKYVIYLLDRGFDPATAYSDFANLHQSQTIHQSVISQKNNQQQNKISKQERIAMQEKEKELEVTKNLNLTKIFQTQLTYMEFLEILLLLSFRKDNKVSKSLSQSIRSVKSVLRKKPTTIGNSSNNNGNNNNNESGHLQNNGINSQQQTNDNYILYDSNKLQQMCNDEQFTKHNQQDKWRVYVQIFIQSNTVKYILDDPVLHFQTQKDVQREQLKDQRERERLQELERQRKEAELAKEERNRLILEQEDVNILSLELEDEEEYDSDY